MPKTRLTVVELREFAARNPLSEEETSALIEHLSRYPTSGPVIRGTGGVRKLRWAIGAKGKSGGARIIYYVYNRSFPLFLITAFRKTVRVDLTQTERNELKQLTDRLISAYRSAGPKGEPG